MSLEIANFGSWYLQVALLVTAGALVPFVARLAAPRPRLFYWYALLAAAMLLPFVQPYRPNLILISGDVSATSGPVRIAEGSASDLRWPTAVEAGTGVLAAGALIRLALLVSGIIRLRRMRRDASALLPFPDEARRAMTRTGASASLFVSKEITGPVTFGLVDPVILLPVGFDALPPEQREPVLFHELLHVRRHDWAFAIAEEIARALLWFHPAIWWLLARIQLTREQVVDQAVVDYTHEPETYVGALLAIASTRLESDLAPAPLFLKKRHLRNRVSSIVSGRNMSRIRSFISSIAVFAALPLVIATAIWQFPLNAAPQEVRDSAGVEVRTGGVKLLHRAPLAFPAEARVKNLSGDVILSVTLDGSGEVADARVVNGPEEFRRSALSSVLGWHFDAQPGQPRTFEITISYNAGQAPPAASQPATGRAVAARSNMGPPPQMTVEKVDVSQLPASLQERTAAALAQHVRPGDSFTPDQLNGMETALKSIDSHLGITANVRNGQITIVPALRGAGMPVVAGPASPSGNPANPGEPPQRIRVGGNVQASNLVTKVTPLYPPEAKAARIQGVVRFEATIDKEGHISNLQLVSGHPLLVPSAQDAVKQWTYRPTLLNGQPVEVITQIDVNYTLAQ